MIAALLRTENAYTDKDGKIIICYSKSLTKSMLSMPDKLRAFCSSASLALDRPIDTKDIVFEEVAQGGAPSDAKILADELEALANNEE
jgi:hypothetical protein